MVVYTMIIALLWLTHQPCAPSLVDDVLLHTQLMRRPYIRLDGRYVKSFLLFFLIFLQQYFSFPLEVLALHQSPAPEGQLPAAGVSLLSYYIPEICSGFERDREHRNLSPCINITHSVSFVKYEFALASVRLKEIPVQHAAGAVC